MSKGIYSIRNSVTSERYIGSSVNVEARWLVHKAQLCQSSHHAPKLQAAWREYGQSCFVLEIIEELSDKETGCCASESNTGLITMTRTEVDNSAPIASRPFTLTDEERGLRAELIRYGLYEPRYIQNIKSQNPLQYDFGSSRTMAGRV
jgi:group I intron endonuclease